MSQLPVIAVSGLHRGENPQPGSAVIRSIRRRFPDSRFVGLSYDPLESGLFSLGEDELESAFSMPFPATGPEALLARIDEIRKELPLGMIIPCLDAELPNYMYLQKELLARRIKTMLPSPLALSRRSKDALGILGYEAGVLVPHTIPVYDLSAAYGAGVTIGYPLIAKGRLYEAKQVNSPAEMAEAFTALTATWGGPMLVQSFLAGEEYDVVGIGDGNGGIIASCSIRKLLLTKTGKAFAGIVVSDPELDAVAARLIGAANWNGPFELEFILSSYGYGLIEFNPRFPAWCDFPSQIGCNLPAAVVELAFGHECQPIERCEPGRLFIRHSLDIVGDITDVAEMSVSGSLKRPDQAANHEVA